MLRLHLLTAGGYFNRLAWAKKLKSQLRLESFEEVGLGELNKIFTVKRGVSLSYVILTSDFGEIRYYSGSDRLVIASTNKWFNNGFDWICDNLLKTKIV